MPDIYTKIKLRHLSTGSWVKLWFSIYSYEWLKEVVVDGLGEVAENHLVLSEDGVADLEQSYIVFSYCRAGKLKYANVIEIVEVRNKCE